jgi:hypothetical protein
VSANIIFPINYHSDAGYLEKSLVIITIIIIIITQIELQEGT